MIKNFLRQNWMVLAAVFYGAYLVAGVVGAKLLTGSSLYQPAKHIWIALLIGFVIGGLVLNHLVRKSRRTL